VLLAENSSVEANEISSSQITSGAYRLRNLIGVCWAI
jgi:hypothetical protein